MIPTPGQNLSPKLPGAVVLLDSGQCLLPSLYTDSLPVIIWRLAYCLAANYAVCISPTRANDLLI